MNVDEITNKIINSPLFLRLKGIEENNSYHDHEKTYDHLIKTYETAKEKIKGDFITNPLAKDAFLNFANTSFEEMTIADTMLLTALVHDVGKLLSYKDGNEEKTLRHEDNNGIVSNPGHEYWGSTIVPLVLKDTGLSEKVIARIARVVRLHDTFGAHYFNPILNWPIGKIVEDVKARAEGFYKEALFNVYCDCFNAKPFEQAKPKVEEVFNQTSLYVEREYFIK